MLYSGLYKDAYYSKSVDSCQDAEACTEQKGRMLPLKGEGGKMFLPSLDKIIKMNLHIRFSEFNQRCVEPLGICPWYIKSRGAYAPSKYVTDQILNIISASDENISHGGHRGPRQTPKLISLELLSYSTYTQHLLLTIN